MSSHFYCPRCKSALVLIYDDHITCPFCGLSFKKEVDKSIDNKMKLEELPINI